MKRLFSNPILALFVGLCLRLFFVFQFPASSGDTVLYEQMAANWLQHGVYAMNVNGAIQPVDLRMPGYPAYLTFIYWLTGKTGDAAHLAVMLGQVAVDLATCILISLLAIFLAASANRHRDGVGNENMFALWLAALCPFTANYVAVPLTEVFANFLTAAATLVLIVLLQFTFAVASLKKLPPTFPPQRFVTALQLAAGFLIGLATLFRPESPLLLVAALLVFAVALFHHGQIKAWLRVAAISGFACVLPLVPWAIRNFATLHVVRFLSPKNSNLPGELVPYGFMAWEKTWLFRMKDCYLAPWKLNSDSIDVDSLPPRAFDSAEEKQRVSQILEKYNDGLTLSPEEDAAFAQIARERTARHPLRTYVWLPALRAVTLWFSPRIELLPVSGHVFPLAQMWEDDKVDQSVTSVLFLLNLFYLVIAIAGACKLWRCSSAAISDPGAAASSTTASVVSPNTRSAARHTVAFFVVFILLRTAFLTTLETPEPRYVLECFPALIALGAIALTTPRSRSANGRIDLSAPQS